MKKILLALLLSAFLLSGCGAKYNNPSLSTGTNQSIGSASNPEQPEEVKQTGEDSSFFPTDVKITEDESKKGQTGEGFSDPVQSEEAKQAKEDSSFFPTDVKIAEDESKEGSAGDGLSEGNVSQQSLSERIALEISYAEEREKEVEKKQEEAATQPEMNETAKELYQLWDDTLNVVWKLLEENLNDADMKVLRKEEKEWIASKDAEVQAAGLENGGGSLQPLLEAVTAAELTKARVYELAKYAEGR